MKLVTAHIPLPLAEKLDQLTERLKRSRGWLMKHSPAVTSLRHVAGWPWRGARPVPRVPGINPARRRLSRLPAPCRGSLGRCARSVRALRSLVRRSTVQTPWCSHCRRRPARRTGCPCRSRHLPERGCRKVAPD
ncbi:MAG: ribbon-helix-helix protein, CopG family [Rhodocyclaceae bacterium]|nr:ribbon-helix-helix protein, CopG family [Rhodocyclaceae bacterium]